MIAAYRVLMQSGNAVDISTIVTIMLLIMFALSYFTDAPQRLQLYRYFRAALLRLNQLESLVNDATAKLRVKLLELGIKEPDKLITKTYENFFVIEPVSIEPTDIIRRLDHLIKTNEEKYKGELAKELPGVSRDMLNNVAVALAIGSALYTIYKIVRHYILLGKKYDNWILLMQLSVQLPQLVKMLSPYVTAIDGVLRGVPMGDGVGPLVASRLLGDADRVEIDVDTVYGVVKLNGRNVYVIKARGPGATVGRPGSALAKLAEELQCKISRIITVDAALKLEGEPSGLVAYGTGAAIGDVGPQKIEIERVAVKCNAQLDAVIVKMSDEEAIKPMSKEIADAAEKALALVKEIIETKTSVGDNVVVIGIGNSAGIW